MNQITLDKKISILNNKLDTIGLTHAKVRRTPWFDFTSILGPRADRRIMSSIHFNLFNPKEEFFYLNQDFDIVSLNKKTIKKYLQSYNYLIDWKNKKHSKRFKK